MVFSRSHTLLRLAYRNTGETINLISRHFAETHKLNERPLRNNLSENVRSDKGYIVQLSNQTNEQSLDQTTTSIRNKLDSPEGKDVVFIEKHVYKLEDALYDVPEILPGPLDKCDEDISHIGPYAMPTYSFAKYADKSRTIQEMVKLGVDLHKLELDKSVLESYLKLDFDKDVKPYIQFLYDCGVPAEHLGFFITKNPNIFQQDMDDLRTRIRYLRAHSFTKEMIKNIVCKNPSWLSFSTEDIDRRLGYFQHNFKLKGYQVRTLSFKCPKVITYKMQHILENTFAVKEEMGFNKDETTHLLLNAPRIWLKSRRNIVETFDYAHNQMNLPHHILASQPHILFCRKHRLEERHRFLVELKRDQYDPSKPMYVSPTAIVSGNDVDFCRNVAKTAVDVYNKFLKSC